jgi:hypothetical protein
MHLQSAMSLKYKHFHSFDRSLNFLETRQPPEYKFQNISQVYDKEQKSKAIPVTGRGGL